jgi:hypothetical protein
MRHVELPGVRRRSPGHTEAVIAGSGFPSDTTYVLAGEIVRLAAVPAAKLRSNLHDE